MEKRVVTVSERAFTTTVNDIEHMESQSMYGLGVIKVFFHPSAKIEMAVAQITSISQSLLRTLPAGFTPPRFYLRFALTRQILPAASSATSKEPSVHTETPTGRPYTWLVFAFAINPVRKSSSGPLGLPS